MNKKNIVIILLILVLLLSLKWILLVPKKQIVSNYYSAMIDMNYEEAINYLYIYDNNDNILTGTELSINDAKETLLLKTKVLEDNNYKIMNYKLEDIRSEEGQPIAVDVHVTIKTSVSEKTILETITFIDNKIVIYSDDEFIKYRNGQLNY